MSMRVMILAGWLIASLAAIVGPASAQGIPRNLPRNETLILENPEGTIKNAGWFNIWAINAGSQSNGLQQAALDTLWYVDPNRGIDGVWDNSLAAEKPIYNADFTEMTVKLRRGIHWSDGVEFTAADVVHTVATQIKHGGMRWSAALGLNVDKMETPDPYTVVFKLKKPNSRFHALFTVRWNAVWIMPKHVFEKVEDPQKFDFNKPVSLGAYVLNSYDPDGKWYIWQLREDWQRTTLGRFGKPGPKYLAYVDPGPPDKRVIAQMNHELDVIHDVAPEGMFALAKQSKILARLVPDFPYAHPDPTLPALIFNTQNELFKNRDVRWALALLIDIKAVSMASYRGAATISAIGVPPTGSHPETYHAPMEEWLKTLRDRHRQAQDQALRPDRRQARSPTCCGPRWASRSRAIRRRSRSPSAWAGGSPIRRPPPELLEKAGYAKRGNAWFTPDGKPFTVRVVVEGESRPVMTRAGSMIVQQWRQFGIDAKVDVAQGTLADPPRRRRFRHAHQLERRDLGRPPGPRPSSSTAGTRSSWRRPASRSRRATGSAGRARSSTRSSSRSAPSASTTRRRSSSAANTSSSSPARCRPSR